MALTVPDRSEVARHVVSLECVLVLLVCYEIYISAKYFGGILEALPINYLFLLAIGTVAILALYRSPPRGDRLLLIVLFGLFTAFYAGSLLWATGGAYAQWKLLRLLVVLPILFFGGIALFAGSPRRTHRFFVLFGVAALLLSTEVLYSRLLVDRAAHAQLNVNYILISRVLGVGVLVCTYFWLRATSTRGRILYGLGALFVFTAMLQTGGRGPLIALTGALFVYGGWLVIRSDWTVPIRHLVAGSLVGVIGAGTAAWFFRDSKTVERLTSLLAWREERSASSRVDYLFRSLEYWRDRPLFGHGIGEFPRLYYGEDIRYYPHNVVLEIGVEAGLVGVALFVSLIGYALYASARTESDRPFLHGLVIAFFTYVLANAMVTGDLSTNRLLFVAIGLLLFADDAPEAAGGSPLESIARVGSRRRPES